MKRALQAILIAGYSMKEDVLYNRKKITIREGHRNYTPGPVLLGCHLLSWATMRNIVSVKHTTLEEITTGEYQEDGFKNRRDLLEGLRKFYPNLNLDSPVTVIRWE